MSGGVKKVRHETTGIYCSVSSLYRAFASSHYCIDRLSCFKSKFTFFAREGVVIGSDNEMSKSDLKLFFSKFKILLFFFLFELVPMRGFKLDFLIAACAFRLFVACLNISWEECGGGCTREHHREERNTIFMFHQTV